MPESAEQQAATRERDRDLFLSAGAGTGKTTVLVRRFCDAVCAEEGEDADVGVENLLAFTFTERAAAELKTRIRSELTRRAAEEPDPMRAGRLRSLAREAESAWISTIHSFCRRVLASHPLAAGIDPSFRVLDESEAARLAGAAFETAFRRFGERGGESRFEMAAAFRVPALRELVRAAHDELRSRGLDRPRLPALEPPDVRGAMADLRAACEEALTATAGTAGDRYVDDCRALIALALAGVEGRTPEEEEVAAWSSTSTAKALQVDEVDRWREARTALERRLVEERFAHHYEHLRELVELFAEEYRRTKLERSALDFEDLQLYARRLLRERAEVRRRLQGRFRHVMVDEFQDTNRLQLSLVELLHEEDGEPRNRLFTVGDELQSIYGFRHADVEVFRNRRVEMEAAPDERAAVLRLAGNFRSRPEVLALVNRLGRASFGSSYEELTVGRPAEPRPAAAGPDGPTVEVLVTERDGWDDPAAELEVSADEQAQPWRVAEARFLADRLRELHDSGVPRREMVVLLRSYGYIEAYEDALEAAGLAPYVVGGRGYWSKQQVADVRNLLACVTNPLDDKALFGVLSSPACGVAPDTLWLLRRAAGRRPVWPALKRLFGPPTAADADAEAEDRAADAAAGSSGNGLAEWRERARESADHVPEEDRPALGELVERLLALRAEAPALSLEALIDRTITATGYDLALLMRRRGRRRMANVRKLMRLAREFEAGEGRDLRSFLDFVDAETEASGREAEAAVDAEGHDGVRVMTVHAAKGLEFPVVAVADLGRGLGAGRGPALRLEPAEPDDRNGGEDLEPMRVGLRLARLGRKQAQIYDYPELERAAVERERREERRILHVAMTRAGERLLLSGAFELDRIGREPKPHDPLIASALRALAWEGEAESVLIEPPRLAEGLDGRLDPVRVALRKRVPAAGAIAARPDVSPAGAKAEGRASFAQAAEESEFAGLGGSARALPDPDLAPPAAPRAEPVGAVSYSALALYERCGYRFYAERVLGMRPRPAGARGGAPAGEGEPGAERRTDEVHTSGADDGVASGYAFGRVVHELLERSARRGWERPDPALAAGLLRREGAAGDPVQVRRLIRLVDGFLRAPVRAELEAAERLHPEAPFGFRAGELLVRGEIDLLAELPGEVLLLDYKSDTLEGRQPAELMERYDVQRRIYALAALRRYGRDVRVAYVFLERPDEPVVERFGPADAPPLRAQLEEMTRGIVEQRFEVTSTPERSLCFDCPARERLCVHGPEMTLRERSLG